MMGHYVDGKWQSDDPMERDDSGYFADQARKAALKAESDAERLGELLATLTRERDEAAAREAVMREAACKCWPASSHHEPGCPVLDDDFSPHAEALLWVVEAAKPLPGIIDAMTQGVALDTTAAEAKDKLRDALRAYQEGSND